MKLYNDENQRPSLLSQQRDRRSRPRVAAFFWFCALSMLASMPKANADEYILGAQDTLKIRVFEWRPSSASAFEWVPLTGDFVVSPAGNLSLPILGTVPAAGKTLEQLADSIGERLQNQVGLQKRPNASVEIASYRPFFVAGLVARPGKYAFNPGLTVEQALSMAGGIGPIDQGVISLQRDAVSSLGDLRGLEDERLELLARQARVDAVLRDDKQVQFPPELLNRQAQPRIAKMMQDEKSLFETRAHSMETEIDALNQTRVLASNQLQALDAKASSLSKQIDLANKDLGSVNKLVKQGLTVSARQLGANQNVVELESRNLDVSLAILKTKQDLAKVDQDVADVRNRYRIGGLTEAAELRDRFSSNASKISTQQELLKNLKDQAPMAIAAIDDTGFDFVVSTNRVIDGSLTSVIASMSDPVAPGDFIRVERRKTSSATTNIAGNSEGR